jgi:hypothetical protein
MIYYTISLSSSIGNNLAFWIRREEDYHQELKRRSWPTGTEEEKLGHQELKRRSIPTRTEE